MSCKNYKIFNSTSKICLLLIPILFGFGIHKYYISIYQIDYVPTKKRVEITARIFADDLNDALSKKYNKTTYLASNKETKEDIVLLEKYLSEKCIIKINGQTKAMQFLSKELETNVIICYLKIENVSNIAKLELENKVLLEFNADQQNLIQYNINNKKGSVVITPDDFKKILN